MKNESKNLGLGEVVLVLVIMVYIAMSVLPSLSGSHHSSKAQAKVEMSALVQGIIAYENAYGHLPISPEVGRAAGSGDFTYGAIIDSADGPIPIGTMADGKVVLNAEVIAVLMDYTNFPGRLEPTVNANHRLNPQQTKFLNAHVVFDNTSPGVGSDLVYRDPWGTPYVITMNLNGDGRCHDVFYSKRIVSQPAAGGAAGYDGLTNSVDAGGQGNHFEYQGRVMVWSAGPDKKININVPANQGENRDNVVSWQ